jgi:hypothetical protein
VGVIGSSRSTVPQGGNASERLRAVNCSAWDFDVRAAAVGAVLHRIVAEIEMYCTAAGGRPVEDAEVGASNAHLS